jgi:hypothetical protein
MLEKTLDFCKKKAFTGHFTIPIPDVRNLYPKEIERGLKDIERKPSGLRYLGVTYTTNESVGQVTHSHKRKPIHYSFGSRCVQLVLKLLRRGCCSHGCCFSGCFSCGCFSCGSCSPAAAPVAAPVAAAPVATAHMVAMHTIRNCYGLLLP